MRVRKFYASCRLPMGELCHALYVAGRAPTLSSEAEGKTTRNPGCGIPRQKVPCLPLSRSARWTVHLREGTPASQFSSGQPEALLGLQLQQIPTNRATNKLIRRQV